MDYEPEFTSLQAMFSVVEWRNNVRRGQAMDQASLLYFSIPTELEVDDSKCNNGTIGG
jgi:hypothetical protein